MQKGNKNRSNNYFLVDCCDLLLSKFVAYDRVVLHTNRNGSGIRNFGVVRLVSALHKAAGSLRGAQRVYGVLSGSSARSTRSQSNAGPGSAFAVVRWK